MKIGKGRQGKEGSREDRERKAAVKIGKGRQP